MIFPLCGNERVRESLANLIPTRRFPHAAIIEGVSGTGKRTLADYIAKALLCENDETPCNRCRSCQLIDAKTHPDLEKVGPEEGKKNIAVAQIDTLREMAFLSPHTSSKKVFIIEKADTMNAASQNKILKILEEPPANVHFILLCDSSSSLLQTVISRCTVFALSEPDYTSAETYLIKQGFDPDEFSDKLVANKNNIGKTLEALGTSKISLGIEVAAEFLNAIDNGNKLSALKCTVPLEKNRAETDVFIKELKFRIIAKIKSSAKLRATRLEYTNMYNAICEYESLLVTNINLSLFFTALVSRLMSLKIN